MNPQQQDLDAGDLNAILTEVADLAKQAGDNPEPMMQGSFAMYPMEDGGVMCVANVAEGPMAGTRHMRLSPNLIRAVQGLASGGGLGMFKALMGGKKRGR